MYVHSACRRPRLCYLLYLQTTNAVILAEAPPKGYGFSEYAIAGAYGTPIVSALCANEGSSS